MRETKGQNSAASPAPIGPYATVPPAKYYELAGAHVRANGGKGVVVSERATPAQWRAWLAYFAWLDDQTTPRGKKARTFRSMTNGATVPTAWPLEFDLSAPPSPPYLPDPPVSAARRKQLADQLRALVSHVAPETRRAPTWRDMTPAAAEQRLSELAEARPPPTVSTAELAAFLAAMAGEAAA